MPDDISETGATDDPAELEARIAGLERALDGLREVPGGLASRRAERLRAEILELERRRAALPPPEEPGENDR